MPIGSNPFRKVPGAESCSCPYPYPYTKGGDLLDLGRKPLDLRVRVRIRVRAFALSRPRKTFWSYLWLAHVLKRCASGASVVAGSPALTPGEP